MYITLVEKSSDGLRLSIYDESLVSLETESFKDSYTLNFHLQALAKKHGIEKSILVIHDKDKNTVNLLLAHEENSFFVS
jgi:predicted DNA-binding protein YlxM (UPF0122 family)